MHIRQASNYLAHTTCRLATKALPVIAVASLTMAPLFAQEAPSESAFDVFKKAGVIGILIVLLSVVALAVISIQETSCTTNSYGVHLHGWSFTSSSIRRHSSI